MYRDFRTSQRKAIRLSKAALPSLPCSLRDLITSLFDLAAITIGRHHCLLLKQLLFPSTITHY
ncbi:hypothetical protein I7I50_07799 [Histoplasma capsulatum G186AR]|uniref:Uncharacterized protein n=1 Tax=Ajellomyces capsulatus TaxID=5037 RepID=A0A8H8D2Z7_AJECA|nr:hypothetical protein I7I52_09128 [Histoplasma capsulatum]QSS68398.1 hypothetical protein I7I50_07799 [Histoplasma capsulatum G186AR]